ncbi:LuxR C-terminal-related transcriptional regulator [Streptomyces wuyuanensis]|uniref:LuxR C-terminal-related transcriptional regulator n=1 Tax=Streptomyces wuyuanensis TaxID=1196353 RepID=UPI003441F44E
MESITRRWPFTGRHDELLLFREALKDNATTAFLIEGPQGAGKTRLSEECLAIAESSGHNVWRTASTYDADFPLAALTPLLPPDFDLQRPLESFHHTIDHLRKERNGDRSDKRCIAIQVDDVNSLDDVSTSVIERLMDSRMAFMIFVRSGRRSLSEQVLHLVYRDSTKQVELPYLHKPEVESLLVAALGGFVEPRTVDYFFDGSEGNVLYLRELVIGAQQAGRLRCNGDLWEMRGPHQPTPRLTDLVKIRLASVGPEERSTLETLALCGTLSTETLQADVSGLESADLVRISRQGRRSSVGLSHPVYGEILRSEVSASQKRSILLKQAERMRRVGARRRQDFLHIARWELAATGVVDASTLLKGSQIARHSYDYEQVKILAEAACRVDEGFPPRLLLGEALYELGETHTAINVLKSAATRARREDERVIANLALTRVICWGLGDAGAAIQVNTEVAGSVHTPESQATLRVARGIFLADMGNLADAYESLRDTEMIPNEDIRALGLPSLATVLAMRGSVGEGLTLARRAYEERLGMADPAALLHPAQNLGPIACALQETGSLNEAYSQLLKGWEGAKTDNDPACLTMLSSALSRAALLQGRPRTARRWASQAIALARRQNFLGPLRPALSRMAEACALMQDRNAAQRASREAESLKEWGIFVPENCLGQVWLHAISGQLSEARGLLAEAIDAARSNGNISSEARLLTDLCRLGDAAAASDRLTQLKDITSGSFTAIRARFAEGMRRQNPTDLMAAADELTKAGAILLSIDATAHAAAIWKLRGNSRKATFCLRNLERLREQCEGAWTPILATAGTSAPLTTRELEIALLVTEGHTNSEIAEQLNLSKRTVDNHLISIFRKLGIESRREIKKTLVK